jgi:hypothetical protein
MVESFVMESSRHADVSKQPDEGSVKCLLEAFASPGSQRNEPKRALENERPVPIKDVPGGSLSAKDNQFYLNYRGLQLPTFTGRNPDGTEAKPFVDDSGKARADGKLQAATDEKSTVLGADGRALLDEMGLRRFDAQGKIVPTRYEASEPAQMLKALDSSDPLTDASRSGYQRAIESADKLDRVALASSVEEHEKFVMAHTTAFLWETAYEQLLQNGGNQEAIKARQAELKEKPVLAEHVRRVREGAALDEEYGALINSSVECRAAYMSRLLAEDSVKKYMSTKDRSLENDANVREAKRVVAELSVLNPALTDRLQPTARLLGVVDLGREKNK